MTPILRGRVCLAATVATTLLESKRMKIVASFFTESEAMDHIDQNNLDGGRDLVVVEKDIFSGKYNVVVYD